MKVQVNEVFGPTFQGESGEVGWPCFFLRLHQCPVKCSFCDTSYTWSGSETHKYKWSGDDLRFWFDGWYNDNPGCGLVVSGGEPLIHYNNIEFIEFIEYVRSKTWVTVETSSFSGPKPISTCGSDHITNFERFTRAFTVVNCSPKLTNALATPEWTHEQLSQNIPLLMRSLDPVLSSHNTRLAFKLVVNGQADIDIVCGLNDKYQWQKQGFSIYLMPFGNTPSEIIKQIDQLVPTLAKTGFLLSPRLHSIVWGNVREK